MESTFGERLSWARSKLGWSQTQLAQLCDMAPTQLSRYESDRATPRKGAISRLAHALDVHPNWLASGEGPIEGGNDGRPLPEGISQIGFEVDAATVEKLDAYAAQRGMTRDMVLRELLRAALSRRQFQQKAGGRATPASTEGDQLISEFPTTATAEIESSSLLMPAFLRRVHTK